MNDLAKLLAVGILLGASLYNVNRIVVKNLPLLKDGVNLDGLQPVMDKALFAIKSVADAMGFSGVVTSGLDGEHMQGSKHYSGEALDARRIDWPDFDNQALAIEQRDRIKKIVGSDFDVLLEATHVHIEYDPKVA